MSSAIGTSSSNVSKPTLLRKDLIQSKSSSTQESPLLPQPKIQRRRRNQGFMLQKMTIHPMDTADSTTIMANAGEVITVHTSIPRSVPMPASLKAKENAVNPRGKEKEKVRVKAKEKAKERKEKEKEKEIDSRAKEKEKEKVSVKAKERVSQQEKENPRGKERKIQKEKAKEKRSPKDS